MAEENRTIDRRSLSITALYNHLKANLNPQHPVPALPKELLDTWTGY